MSKFRYGSRRMLLVVALLTAPAASAQELVSIDPYADAVIRQMSDYLKGADEFSFSAALTADDELPSGLIVQASGRVQIAIRRPDAAWWDGNGDPGHKRFIYDGRQITFFDLDRNLYAQTSAPNRIDAALDQAMNELGIDFPLASFVLADAHATMLENVESGVYLGVESVGDRECHHVAFTTEDLDWQLWVLDGPRPLPVRLVVTYPEIPGQPTTVANIGDWTFHPPLPDSLFDFEPPPGAHPIEFETVGSN